MKNWQKDSIRKSIDNYVETGDEEHLADIVRVYRYSKFKIIKSRVSARLKEITYKILFLLHCTKRKESSNEIH